MQIRIDSKIQDNYYTFRKKRQRDNRFAYNNINFCAKNNNAERNAKLISNALNNQIAIVKLKGELDKIISKVKLVTKNSVEETPSKNNSIFNNRLRMIISDMKLASKNADVNIPNSILISGDINSTDNVFDGIKSELQDLYNITEFSIPKENTEIIKELTKLLNTNKQNYLSNQKRNIIIVKNAERLLNSAVSMYDIIGIKLTEEDKEVLANCKGNMDIVSFFKILLDVSALVPRNKKKCTNGYATTFLFTSQNPHLIHPDLITRNSRIASFFCDIPNGRAMKDLILRTIYQFDRNFEDQFGENDWQTILKLLNPNSNKGGLSVRQIEDVISGYYNKFNDKKETNILQDELNIVKLLLEAPRSINTKECRKFSYLAKSFGERNIPSEKFSIQDLIIQKKLGLLPKKLESAYESGMAELNNELGILNRKLTENKLSKKDIKRRNTILNIINSI